MTTVAGMAFVIGGLAFGFLGIVTLIELLRRRSRPAASARFGIAFLLIAVTHGPYHALFGLRILAQDTVAPGPLVVVGLMALVPLMAFVGLRVEALTGERAERFIPGIPIWLPVLPMIAAMVAGAAGWMAVLHARETGVAGIGLVTEFADVLVSAAVGAVLLYAQVERRRILGGWSLSALSLTALFPSFAFAHATGALIERGTTVEMVLGALSLPAMLHFLWVVRRLHRSFEPSRRKRPLVGPAARTVRTSPWAGPGAEAAPIGSGL